MITNVGQLIDELQKYDRKLPIQAIVMESNYSIENITTENGVTIDENKTTDIVCLHIPIIHLY